MTARRSRCFASLSKLILAGAVGLATLGASEAHAQDDKVARAAVLAREAEDLLAKGNVPEACNKLEESQALDPRGGTLLDLALCREKEGRIGTAYNLFVEAEKVANEEKRNDRVTTARVRKNALFLKLPRVTITVPAEVVVEGLEIRLGHAGDLRSMKLVPQSEWGKALIADPGDLVVMASAPKKATWQGPIKVANAERKSVTVPPLAEGDGPAPLPPIVENPPPNTNPDPNQGQVGVTPPSGPAQAPVPTTPAKHEAGRVVVDVGAIVGAHLSLLSSAPLADINGTEYIYRGPEETEFLASCGNTDAVPGAGNCSAKFDPQFGFLGGAQLFLGYALTDKIQFGGRFLGGVHFPLGFMALGGPSISFHAVGPFWFGVSVLLGTTQIESVVTGAKGEIPDAYETDNDSSTIDIPVEELAGRGTNGEPFAATGSAAAAFGGFEVGGSFEVSIVLIDNPQHDGSGGALMLSAWPLGMWSPGNGAVISVPVGIGYRFY
jgi:hypothetical protein